MKVGKILYAAAVILLLVIFAGSAIYVGRYFYEASRQQSEYDDLAAIVESARQEPEETQAPATPAATEEPDATEETEPQILREYRTLYDMNNHMVGWLKIDGTAINYPVMQSPEETDYYLHRNFNRQHSDRGCLYVREVCDVFAPSDNLTIYGHNMVDGSMFHDLDKYRKKDFWEAHDTILFDTLYEHHTYRIFAVFRTTATIGEGFSYHKFIDAADEAAFDEFIATCKSLSIYDTGITPVYGDKIICLSTCEYTQANGRFVVAAVRVS